MSSINWQQLKQIYPLNQLRKDLIDGLLANLRVRTYARGQMLFDFNDSPDDYFYVIEGEVELVAHAPKGTQLIGPAAELQAMPNGELGAGGPAGDQALRGCPRA